MTAAEINNRFDFLYDNALSGQAPGINMYEKSMCLTQAYKEIIKEIAADSDKTEKRRVELSKLLVNTYINYDAALNSTLTAIKTSPNSRIFELPEDCWYKQQERLYISANNSIRVTPKTRDEYNVQITNRFRKPSTLEAWRLDLKDTISETEKQIIEIISTTVPVKYFVSYIKRPKPVILESLSGTGYTIDGLTAITLPEVSDELHEAIIKRAVLIAVETYKPQDLEHKMVVTNREN